MSFTNEIAQRIGPYMKSRGFKRKGGRFYYVQNDIAFCVDLEMPTASVYVWAYVLPLYMPCDFIPLSYGNRMGNMPSVMLPSLLKTDSGEQIESWCSLLCRRIEDTIVPLYRSIATPQKLAAYIENEAEYRAFMHGTKLDMERLRVYTDLYLHETDRLAESMDRYARELKSCTYLMPAVVQNRMEEIQSLRAMNAAGEDELSRFFLDAIGKTSKLFQ